MTKREKRFYYAWLRSEKRILEQVYSRYSTAKADSFKRCVEDCAEINGHRFRIISHNCNFYTVGYVYELNGKNFLRVQTAYNTYDFEIPYRA
ncbi:MAG: hypothetical protein J6T10_30580 [Methanobrevibacter sp.]|nr:hypothetical protein [Methanobrevibacter sp.]